MNEKKISPGNCEKDTCDVLGRKADYFKNVFFLLSIVFLFLLSFRVLWTILHPNAINKSHSESLENVFLPCPRKKSEKEK